MFKGFKDFILRGNVVDLAVGVVIGAAFGTVIDSIVAGLIDPIVGAILPGDVNNLAGMVWDIGGAEIGWGLIISTLITFVATAFAIYFFVVLPMNKLAERRKSGDEGEEPTNEEKIVSLLEQIASK
ncbi:MAG: large conductance mechanosensitive channel protein MscL [Microthrixaceae bacterium]